MTFAAHRIPPSVTRSRSAARRQRGSFLLEALISVFIVALAVLGLVGLIARSMQNVDDSKYRGEAAAMTATLIGTMWVSNRTTATLAANFSKASSGAGYTEFKNLVAQRLPNATDPDVVVAAGATANSTDVTITVNWKPPGEGNAHTYQTFATIGANN